MNTHDYFFTAFIALFILWFGHWIWLYSVNVDNCHQICEPLSGLPDAAFLSNDVSCICDLTKERIEIP